jgi:hypothetical protein
VAIAISLARANACWFKRTYLACWLTGLLPPSPGKFWNSSELEVLVILGKSEKRISLHSAIFRQLIGIIRHTFLSQESRDEEFPVTMPH